jgi:hypothetical protein
MKGQPTASTVTGNARGASSVQSNSDGPRLLTRSRAKPEFSSYTKEREAELDHGNGGQRGKLDGGGDPITAGVSAEQHGSLCVARYRLTQDEGRKGRRRSNADAGLSTRGGLL